jgi:hypothetical protein
MESRFLDGIVNEGLIHYPERAKLITLIEHTLISHGIEIQKVTIEYLSSTGSLKQRMYSASCRLQLLRFRTGAAMESME